MLKFKSCPLALIRAAALSACAISTFLAGPAAAQNPDPEVRALWVSRFEWPSGNENTAKNNIIAIMNQAHANNFNTILFQVRGQCDVHYNSPFEPWSNTYGWTNPGWDPLQFAIEQAHARGMELHAYINTHVLSSPIPPAVTTPQHPYNLHGPNVPVEQCWLIRDSGGNIPNVDGYQWISPGIPEASAWTRKMVLDIVKRYDVDGVHFDRIRSPGSNYTYDIVSRARWNNGIAGGANPDGLTIESFMRSAITRDLRNIYAEIQHVKPHVQVSAAPFGIVYKDGTTHYQGTGTQSYYDWFQDSWTWMQEHTLDFMVPQIYWQVGSAHPFEKLLQDWMERAGGRYVVAGSTTSVGGKTVSALLAEHNQTRLQGAAGHCIFSYSSMTNYWSSFGTGVYDEPTTKPLMPWKTTPTVGTICGTVTDAVGNPVLDALVKLEGHTYNYLSAHDGFFGILNVPPGTPLNLTAQKAGAFSMPQSVMVTAGGTTSVSLVLVNPVGSVSLDAGAYQSVSTASIEVKDDNLIGDGTVGVVASTTSEPSGEVVTLTETGPGVFQGTIELNTTPAVPVPGDGILTSSNADVLEVLYIDEFDGVSGPHDRIATSTIDDDPPVISNVTAFTVGAVTANITLSTNEAANVVLHYGSDCGTLSQITPVSAGTAHSISIGGLTPDRTYYFTVTATDEVGNEASEDNGGDCFTFTTLAIPVGLQEKFENGASDWSGTGLWRYVTNGSTCAAAHSGVGAWYYGNASCNYNTGATNSGSLISPEFVVPEGGRLSLWSREQTEDSGTNWDTRRIFVRHGVSGRTQVHQSINNANQFYYMGPIDLSAYAGQVVRLEFEFNSVDNFGNDFAGWYVDDILVDSMSVTPPAEPIVFGPEGGPFSDCLEVVLSNHASVPLNWQSNTTVPFMELSQTTGTIPANDSITVSLCANETQASALPIGEYPANVSFSAQGSSVFHEFAAALHILNPPAKAVLISPPDGATNVDTTFSFAWETAEHAESYDFYFGFNSSPSFIMNINITDIPVSDFPFGTTFYWRVDTRNGVAVTEGDVWSFTTMDGPTIQTDPTSLTLTLERGETTEAAVLVSNLAATGGATLSVQAQVTAENPTEVTEQVGISAGLASGINRYRGHVYEVTESTLLTRIEQNLNFSGTVDIDFVVFESPILFGTNAYQKIYSGIVTHTGTGDNFYASNPLSIQLKPGFFYVIAAGWGSTNVGYPFRNDSGVLPRTVSFGFQRNGYGVDNTFMIGATTSNGNSINSYPQKLTIGQPWLELDPSVFSVEADASVGAQILIDTANLPVGDSAATVTLLSNDPFNGETDISVTVTVTDTTPPDAPSVPDLDPASDSGLFNDDDLTNIKQTVINGTAEPGATVTLLVDGNPAGEGPANQDGEWSIMVNSELGDGVYDISARARDDADNVGSDSAALEVTIDTTPPAVSSTPDLTEESDTGDSSNDNLTNDTTPTFSGTTEDGVRVELVTTGRSEIAFAFGGIYEIGFSVPLAHGIYAVSARSIDEAGNVSELSDALTVTIDIIGPGCSTPDMLPATDTGLYNNDNRTMNLRPQFEVTTEANIAVELLAVGNVVATGISNGSGVVVLQPLADLAAFTQSITARATDAAGNLGNPSPVLSAAIDLEAPTVQIGQVLPDPRTSAVASVQISFSEAIYDFDTSEITLYGDLEPVALGGASITGGPTVYNLVNLESATSEGGDYRIEVNPGNIKDLAGNLLLNGSAEEWTTILSADLEVSITPSASEALIGDPVAFTYVVHNYGFNLANDVQLQIELSEDSLVTGVLAPGATESPYGVNGRVIHFGTVQKDQTVSATVLLMGTEVGALATTGTLAQSQEDPDLTNSVALAEIDILLGPGPDLYGVGALMKWKCKEKKSITRCRPKVSLLLVNRGDTPTPKTVVRIWFSEDEALDESDLLLKSFKGKKLKLGASKLKKQKLKLPDDASSGYILFEIDPENELPEASEFNNLVVVPVP